MKTANYDIREAIARANLRNWQVAAKLGINDGNFSRKLRFELSKTEKQRVFQIIKELKSEQKEA